MRIRIFSSFTLLSVLTACNPQTNPTPTPTPSGCPVPAVSHVVSSSQFVSHLPRALRQFQDAGSVNEDQNLSVTIELGLNNEADLDRMISEIYRPGSPTYHQFISPQEFKARYAPTAEQVNAVQAQLKAQGVSSTLHENGYLLKAQGRVASLGSFFKTEIHNYLDSKGAAYFAPAFEPQVPTGSIIRAIHGLHNVTRWTTHAAKSSASPLRAGTGPNGGLSPADIRSAYTVPTSVNGSGEALALFELDGYKASDITQYENTFGLSKPTLTNVLVSGVTGAAGSGADEVTLDIELMIAVAPGASKIIVYEGPNTGQGVLDTYARIANDNLARQVSTSWGAPEISNSASFLQTENTIFKQMASQGQTVYAAAGDSGAYDNGTSLGVDDPASQPYVIGVGGTKLFTTANGLYDHETTWNNGSPSSGAGGGGISAVWTQPTWQHGAITAASLGSTSMRNVPDVSLDSDPATGYAIYVGGQWHTFGGTSCAAPLWAAFTALVNQQRISAHLAPVGFLNPIFYQIGLSTSYDTDFTDIADNSTNLHYPAVRQYDNATGWGSFKGQGLFNDLIKDTLVVTPVTPGC